MRKESQMRNRNLSCWGLIISMMLLSSNVFGQEEMDSFWPAWRPYVNNEQVQENYSNNLTLDDSKELGNLVPARFLSVDRLANRFPSYSPYVYSLNNPVVFVDANGDSAWAIHNQWSSDMIKQYQAYASKRAEEYAKNKTACTCEDLALNILIDFASANGLPLVVVNQSGSYSAAADAFTDVQGFRNTVLETTGARDLQNPLNTTAVALSDVATGDLLLGRNQAGIAFHTQMVTSVQTGAIGIHQGNFGTNWYNRTSDPSSWFYIGAPVQRGTINLETGVFTNQTLGRTRNDFMSVYNIQSRRWRFGRW
jgi:hypothetical protein